ncbi:UNVERIFIED_CONTAM: hypothetical protein K2H54_033705 [Gekko kuhli]
MTVKPFPDTSSKGESTSSLPPDNWFSCQAALLACHTPFFFNSPVPSFHSCGCSERHSNYCKSQTVSSTNNFPTPALSTVHTVHSFSCYAPSSMLHKANKGL